MAGPLVRAGGLPRATHVSRCAGPRLASPQLSPRGPCPKSAMTIVQSQAGLCSFEVAVAAEGACCPEAAPTLEYHGMVLVRQSQSASRARSAHCAKQPREQCASKPRGQVPDAEPRECLTRPATVCRMTRQWLQR